MTGEVLLATIAAGGGHVATARAMAEAITAASGGGLSVRVSDVMKEYGAAELDARHKATWREMLARPWLVRGSQAVMDAAPAVSRAAQNLLLARFTREVTQALNEDPPALVVVNHGWLATAFTAARRRHGLLSPVVVFETEPFDASALWSAPNAQTVLAPSAAAAADLRRLGVPTGAVHVSGYPVAQRFYQGPSRDEARRALGLGDGFVALLSLGAEGVADAAAVTAVLRLAEAGVTVLCVTGRNEELARRLSESAAAAGVSGSVVPLGYVERMEVPLAACDVMVGKAGPASTMEAVAACRPVISASYAGLNELAVVRFLTSYGLGEHAGSFGELPSVVLAWRDDPSRLERARAAAAAFDFGAMAAGIGAFLVGVASGDAPEPSLLAPGAMADVGKRALSRRARGPAKEPR